MSAPLLTATEVASIFRVDPKSVIRWLQEGKIDGFKTPGGHWRIHRETVEALLPEFKEN